MDRTSAVPRPHWTWSICKRSHSAHTDRKAAVGKVGGISSSDQSDLLLPVACRAIKLSKRRNLSPIRCITSDGELKLSTQKLKGFIIGWNAFCCAHAVNRRSWHKQQPQKRRLLLRSASSMLNVQRARAYERRSRASERVINDFDLSPRPTATRTQRVEWGLRTHIKASRLLCTRDSSSASTAYFGIFANTTLHQPRMKAILIWYCIWKPEIHKTFQISPYI